MIISSIGDVNLGEQAAKGQSERRASPKQFTCENSQLLCLESELLGLWNLSRILNILRTLQHISKQLHTRSKQITWRGGGIKANIAAINTYHKLCRVEIISDDV
jgi:hypothetical protein